MSQIEQNYHSLLKSGMFWEFHPHLTGQWEKDKDWFYQYVNGSLNNQNSTVWKSLISEPPHHYPKRYFLRMGLNGEPRSMPFLSKNSTEEYIDYGFTEWKEIE